MRNENVNFSSAILAVIAIMVAAYFYYENKLSQRRILELEQNNLRLILESIKENEKLSEEIKKQLQNLVTKFQLINRAISHEIIQAIQLFEIGQKENAIEDLVKIIEHLLTKHYEKNQGFKAWLKKKKKQISLHNMLSYCKFQGMINEIEFSFLLAIKKIRNKEAHTLNLELDDNLSASGILAAISGIMKVAQMVYPNNLSANERATT